MVATFRGQCVGVDIELRGDPGVDDHLCFAMVVHDDGNWFKSGDSMSSFWLSEALQMLQAAETWLKSNAEPDGKFGWKLRGGRSSTGSPSFATATRTRNTGSGGCFAHAACQPRGAEDTGGGGEVTTPDYAAIAAELRGAPHGEGDAFVWLSFKSSFTLQELLGDYDINDVAGALSELAEFCERMAAIEGCDHRYFRVDMHGAWKLPDDWAYAPKEGERCLYCSAEYHGGKWL